MMAKSLISSSSSHIPPPPAAPLHLSLLLLLINFPSLLLAELPQELDPFLERLFETAECETFLADGSFLAVATRECPPHHCDFPRQLCMRPSLQYQHEDSNQCRNLPEQCLLTANGGQLLAASSSPSPPPSPPPAQVTEVRPSTAMPVAVQVSTNRPPLPATSSHGSPPICEQGPPEGRFCGFSLKFAYNRETRNCDQFWFPGCRTERTNQNLFDTLQECLQAVRHCARAEPIFRPQPSIGPPPPPPSPDSFGGPSPGQLPPPQPTFVQPHQPETPFGQAGQFLRLITNTIREVRDPRNGQQGGGGAALRWDPAQLGGILQTLGGRRKRRR